MVRARILVFQVAEVVKIPVRKKGINLGGPKVGERLLTQKRKRKRFGRSQTVRKNSTTSRIVDQETKGIMITGKLRQVKIRTSVPWRYTIGTWWRGSLRVVVNRTVAALEATFAARNQGTARRDVGRAAFVLAVDRAPEGVGMDAGATGGSAVLGGPALGLGPVGVALGVSERGGVIAHKALRPGHIIIRHLEAAVDLGRNLVASLAPCSGTISLICVTRRRRSWVS